VAERRAEWAGGLPVNNMIKRPFVRPKHRVQKSRRI
jgi:hypothetical protein